MSGHKNEKTTDFYPPLMLPPIMLLSIMSFPVMEYKKSINHLLNVINPVRIKKEIIFLGIHCFVH